MGRDVLLQLLAIGLSNGAVIALNAIGVTLVYGAIRLINFAHGDLFALTTVVVTSVILGLGLRQGLPGVPLIGGLGLTLAASMAFGTVLNLVIERVAFRPFRSGSRLAPLIASIGISLILYQVALLWRVSQINGPEHHSDVDNLANASHQGIPDLLPQIDLVRVSGLNVHVVYTLKDLLVLLIAAGLALAVSLFLRRTRAGRALRACAQDAELAELCGVNRDRVIQMAFAIGGALAGAGAFVFALYYDRPFGQHGVQSGLVAFAAAVMGGIGGPIGAFLSGLLFGVLSALSDFFLAPQWTPVIVLSILIVLLVLRPTGLAGEERGGELPPSPDTDMVGGPTRGAATWRSRWLTRGLLALALVYPALDLALGLHQQVIVTGVLLFALLALGLNLLLGFAGLLDLGYAACFGIGGYTAAVLTTSEGRLAWLVPQPVDFLVVLALSAAAAGLFGAVNGVLTLRLRGDYLAIVALSFGQLVPRVFLNLDQWTGGANGMAALPPPRILTHPLNTPVEHYYLALALVLLGGVACQRLARSRIGRAWIAMSQDETAAVSCGVSAAGAKPFAFIVGAMIAGIAGALSASIIRYVDVDQSDFMVSAMVLSMVVIGGTGSVRGAIIGALAIAGYIQVVIPLLGDWLDRLGQGGTGPVYGIFEPRALNFLFFGLALYLTVLFRARGTPAWQRGMGRMIKRLRPPAAVAVAPLGKGLPPPTDEYKRDKRA